LIVLVTFIRKSDLFSPSKVFGIIWAMAIGLTELKLSRHQHNWNEIGWIMLLIGISSFYVGVFIVFVINYNKKITPINTIRNIFNERIVDHKKLFNVIIILFIVYVASFMGNYLIEGFLPIFHANPGQSRAYWGVFGIGLTIHAATSLILFGTQYVTLADRKVIKRMVVIGIIVSTFITYLFILQRFNLMFAIISSIVFLYYSSNSLRPRNAGIVFLIIVALMYSVQYLRMSDFALSYLYNLAQMKFSFKYAIFTEPYMYVVMNLENFVRAVNRLEDHTFGYYTFNFMLSLSGLKKPLNDYWTLNNFPFLNSSYNTYSMFWDFFRDFGIYGLSLIPAVIGFGVSTFYYKLRKDPSVFTLSIYSIFIFVLVISFFVNVIGLLHFVFNTSLIVALSYYISRDKNSHAKVLVSD
jgi:oligosaccharide repeat unit polymerase